MNLCIVYFLILSLTRISTSLNVLFYTAVVGSSHIYFLNSAIKVLVENGHTVDVILSVYNEMVNVKLHSGVRNVHNIRFRDPDYWKKNAAHLTDLFVKKPRPFEEFEHFQVAGLKLCKIALNDRELNYMMSSGNYSIGLTSDYDPCGNILLTAHGIPSIASLIPTPLLYRQVVSAGLPTVASVNGKMLAPENDGSFYDRVINLLHLTYYHQVNAPRWDGRYNKLIRSKYGVEFPDVSTIERNVDVVFANSNEFLEKQRPLSQKIKYIGGMGVKEAKKLPIEFENILSAPGEFVLFSFGTQVPTKEMPLHIRKNFIEAFRKFENVTFLWKYDSLEMDYELFEDAPNIRRLEWLPQTELLHDPRVKLFISHMGLNSYLETSFAGVPVLAIPLFADQQNNAQNARDREMGILLDRDRLTSTDIESSLRELLTDPKYSRNALAISKMMREKPEKPEDVFLKWVEFAARNPGLHKMYELPGAEMSPFHYYCGDIALFFLMLTAISLYILKRIANRITVSVSKRKID